MIKVKESEKQFASYVEDLLDLHGWRWYHTFDSRRSHEGFFDYVAMRRGMVLFIEIKTETGRVRPEQVVWGEEAMDVEAANPLVFYYLWRPSDRPIIEAVLK